MRKYTNTAWSLICLLAAFTLLAGCAPIPGAPPQPAATAPAAVPVEGSKIILRVGTGDSGEGLTPHQEIISRFEQANPDILVQLEAVAGNDYYTRLLTQIAAKRPPDIIQVGDDAVPYVCGEGRVPAVG